MQLRCSVSSQPATTKKAGMKCESQNPTRPVFGAGSLQRLGAIANSYGPKALLVTGGGSAQLADPQRENWSEAVPTGELVSFMARKRMCFS